EGKYRKAQSLNQKYFKIARYSFNIFNPNLAHFCISEVNILNRTQVITKVTFNKKSHPYKTNGSLS
uniref:hypothetical protein n=1 Tax=Draconibacterium sp. TaxID=1965318 RepID=UPI0035661BE0